MVRRSGRGVFDRLDLDGLLDRMRSADALEVSERTGFVVRELVDAVWPAVEDMKAKGYSLRSIAEFLVRDAGVRASVETLRTAMGVRNRTSAGSSKGRSKSNSKSGSKNSSKVVSRGKSLKGSSVRSKGSAVDVPRDVVVDVILVDPTTSFESPVGGVSGSSADGSGSLVPRVSLEALAEGGRDGFGGMVLTKPLEPLEPREGIRGVSRVISPDVSSVVPRLVVPASSERRVVVSAGVSRRGSVVEVVEDHAGLSDDDL